MPPTANNLALVEDKARLVLVHHLGDDRQVVAAWKDKFEDFKAEVRRLFQIPEDDCVLHLTSDLEDPFLFDLDFYKWRLIKGRVNTIYVSAERLSPTGPTIPGRIQVRTKDRDFSVSIPNIEVAIVEDIKRVIENVERIPSTNQALIFGDTQLHSSRTLRGYCIKNESTIDLVVRSNGCVNNGSVRTGVVKIQISPEDTFLLFLPDFLQNTVDYLKNRVRKREGLPVENQTFFFAGLQLGGHVALANYDIKDMDTVHLVLRSYGGNEPLSGKSGTIILSSVTGRKIPVFIHDFSSTTFNKMLEGLDFPPDMSRLVWRGAALVTSRNFGAYDIKDDECIHHGFRILGGGDWGSLFRQWGVKKPPIRHTTPILPSPPMKPNLICLRYKHRSMLTSWNCEIEAFKASARCLFEIAMDDQIVFLFEIPSFGNEKMEVDPGVWRNLEGQINTAWLVDRETYDTSVAERALENST